MNGTNNSGTNAAEKWTLLQSIVLFGQALVKYLL